MQKRVVAFLWGGITLFVFSIVVIFLMIAIGKIGYVPKIDQLQKPISEYASQILSSDGKLIGTWSKQENRVFVDYDEISPNLIKALIATEDERFYSHSGIDGKALIRALVKRGLWGKQSAGGGSTITQQLAKQLYSSTAETTWERLLQKPIEWVIAVKLERNYTKEEILTLYLNYFDFLHNAVGIKMAANTYFGKLPKDLTLCEAATLVGMCKNPSYYNPLRELGRCRDRRNVVLSQMYKYGYISRAEYNEQKEQPLELDYHRADHKKGLATYFRENLRQILMAKRPDPKKYASWQRQKYYDDSLAWEKNPIYGWCNKHTKKDGSHYNIYTDGLKFYTTIDSRMQYYAEEVVRNHVQYFLQKKFEKEKKNSKNYPFSNNLSKEQSEKIIQQSIRQSDRYREMQQAGCSEKEINRVFNTPTHMIVYTGTGEKDTIMSPRDSILYYKSFLRTGFIAMDPLNGYVKAYVGGLDYSYFQYDMCSGGRRQVGSTIKPFLYSLALENGFTSCDLVPNVRQTYIVSGKPWTPSNSNHSRYGQMVSLKWGLSQSNNWISAYLMNHLNPMAFVRLLHEYGIQNQEIFPSMSLCLGTCDISVEEMASAYTAFVNKGIRVAPLYITKIEDGDGTILADFQPQMNEVISEETSYQMLDMLQAVIDSGTGTRIRYKYQIKAPMAGKTGTTNNHSDGWFVGMIPRLVGACWVGGENRDIHFDNMQYGQGASTALPIWAYFLKKVYGNTSLGYSNNENFGYPEDFKACMSKKEGDEILENVNETTE